MFFNLEAMAAGFSAAPAPKPVSLCCCSEKSFLAPCKFMLSATPCCTPGSLCISLAAKDLDLPLKSESLPI